MATKNLNKIYVTVDGETKELIGDDLIAYNAQKELDAIEAQRIFDAEAKIKADKTLVLERLGITEEEAKLLLS